MQSLKVKRLRSLLAQIVVSPPRLGPGCTCSQWETCSACWARMAAREARSDYELAEFRKRMGA